jgi:uncharacterized membrane protein required for colicin V production
VTLTWLDVILVVIMGLVVFGGYKRGLILEMFDWLVVILAATAAFGAYRAMARALSFLGWDSQTLLGTSFFVVFCLVGTGVFVLGLMLDRSYRQTLPKPVNEACGSVLAFVKSFFLAWLILVMLWHLPFHESFYASMKTAPVVQGIQRMVLPAVFGMLNTFTSRDVATTQKEALLKKRF